MRHSPREKEYNNASNGLSARGRLFLVCLKHCFPIRTHYNRQATRKPGDNIQYIARLPAIIILLIVGISLLQYPPISSDKAQLNPVNSQNYFDALTHLLQKEGIELDENTTYTYFLAGRSFVIRLASLPEECLIGVDPGQIHLMAYSGEEWVELPVRIYDYKIETIYNYYYVLDKLKPQTNIVSRLPLFIPRQWDRSNHTLPPLGRILHSYEIRLKIMNYEIPVYLVISKTQLSRKYMAYMLGPKHMLSSWETSLPLPSLSHMLVHEDILEQLGYTIYDPVVLLKSILNKPLKSVVISVNQQAISLGSDGLITDSYIHIIQYYEVYKTFFPTSTWSVHDKSEIHLIIYNAGPRTHNSIP